MSAVPLIADSGCRGNAPAAGSGAAQAPGRVAQKTGKKKTALPGGISALSQFPYIANCCCASSLPNAAASLYSSIALSMDCSTPRPLR